MLIVAAIGFLFVLVAVASAVVVVSERQRGGVVRLGVHVKTPPPGPEALPPSKPRTPNGEAFAEWLLMAASEQTGVDLSKDAMARMRLAERSESALVELRANGSAKIELPFLTADASGPKHFSTSFTRDQVETTLGLSLR